MVDVVLSIMALIAAGLTLELFTDSLLNHKEVRTADTGALKDEVQACNPS